MKTIDEVITALEICIYADACEPIYQKIIEGCKLNGKELSIE